MSSAICFICTQTPRYKALAWYCARKRRIATSTTLRWSPSQPSRILAVTGTLLTPTMRWTIASMRGRAPGTANLRAAWENVLFNQFHDILPGSGIREIYIDATKRFRESKELGEFELDERVMGGASIDAVVDHLLHVIDVAGEDVPALGSDFDGFVVPREADVGMASR